MCKLGFRSLVLFSVLSQMLAVCSAADLGELQGVWEMHFQQAGRNLRAVKTIQNDIETVETYDGEALIHRHVVKIELVDVGELTVMKWQAAETTHGPRKGEKGQPGSLVSRRIGDKWVNATGLMKDDNLGVTLQVFTRVKEEVASAPRPRAAKIVSAR